MLYSVNRIPYIIVFIKLNIDIAGIFTNMFLLSNKQKECYMDDNDKNPKWYNTGMALLALSAILVLHLVYEIYTVVR